MPIDLWEKDWLRIGRERAEGRRERVDIHEDGEGPRYIGPQHLEPLENRGVRGLEGGLPFEDEGFPGRGPTDNRGRGIGLAVASRRVIGDRTPHMGVDIWSRRPGKPPGAGKPDEPGQGNRKGNGGGKP